MDFLGEIADYYIEQRGGSLFLSHKDYLRILSWEKLGIDPKLIQRVIDKVFDGIRGPDGKPVKRIRSIAYLERAIFTEHNNYTSALHTNDITGEDSSLLDLLKENLGDYEAEIIGDIQNKDLPKLQEFILVLREGFKKLHDRIAEGVGITYEDAALFFQNMDKDITDYLLNNASPEVMEETLMDATSRMSRYSNDNDNSSYNRTAYALRRELLRRKYAFPRIAIYSVV